MKKLLGVLLVLVYSCTTTNDGNTTTTTVVPLPPTNLVGTISPLTTINLSWIDNSTNETGFKIERKVSGGDYALIGTTGADKTTFSDSGLSLGVTYTYRVYAYNAVGSSLTYAYSLEIKIANVPILTTTLATLTFGGGASSGGNITDNGGSDVTARGVVWSTNSSPTIDLPTKTVDGTGNGLFTSAITGLTAGTTYYVRAYATNGAGTAYGDQITFTLPTFPTNGLVGYWPFNGNANDMSGNGNNGTVNGATLTTDRFGNANSAYSFSNNYISLSQAFFNGSTNVNSLTYSVWFKCSQLPSSSNAYSLSNKEGYWRSIGLGINSSGLVSYGGSQPNPQSYFGITSQNAIILNQWNQVIVTFDNSTLKLYLNGNLENTSVINYSTLDYSYLAIGNSTSTNLIGASYPVSPGLTNFTIGIIDDFGVWNRALTQAEITALYNSTGK